MCAVHLALECVKDACAECPTVCVMQNKLVAIVQEALDGMQKKLVHSIKEFATLEVSCA